MKKNLLLCLAAAAVVCFMGSTVYAGHSQYHCLACHQPHQNFDPNFNPQEDWGVPLFSTEENSDGLPTYDIYSSHWFDKYGITVGQPNGASKLCLGCHDGSYQGHQMEHVFGAADLNKSHPISINYDEARDGGAALWLSTGEHTTPLGHTIAIDLLDEKGNVQCTSCHDVHNTGVTESLLKFEPGRDDMDLCKACHNK